MKNSNNTATVIGALVVGTLAGAALGVLFAPYKGNRTRNRLVRRAKDIVRDFKKQMKQEASILQDQANELYDLAGEEQHDITNNGKQKAANAMKN